MELTEKQAEVVNLFKQTGSETTVAKILGKDIKTIINHLWFAYKKGIFNETHQTVLPAKHNLLAQES